MLNNGKRRMASNKRVGWAFINNKFSDIFQYFACCYSAFRLITVSYLYFEHIAVANATVIITAMTSPPHRSIVHWLLIQLERLPGASK